jgi:hypothetical protein
MTETWEVKESWKLIKSLLAVVIIFLVKLIKNLLAVVIIFLVSW